MLRFDQCVCGTSTTGTGTLTLAATPVPPGGVDFDVWARALGFGNGAALLVDYTLIEFADSAFSKAHQAEAGSGALTLGSSAGIANCTLARTTIDYAITGMDSPPASVSVRPAGGITIGTAANVLVLAAPRSLSLRAFHPYFETALGDANWGVGGDGCEAYTSLGATPAAATTTNQDWYIPVRWSVPMRVKRVSWRIQVFGSITGSPVVYARLYDWNTSGRPGKLLYDFTPTSGVAITGTGTYSAAAGTGFLMAPGDYVLDLCVTGLTGGQLEFANLSQFGKSPAGNRFSAVNGITGGFATATGGTAGAGPDPANTAGYGIDYTHAPPVYGFAPS